MICAVATFIGDWLYLKNDPASRPGSICSVHSSSGRGPHRYHLGAFARSRFPLPLPSRPVFSVFLGINLVLVAMLSCVALLMDRWKQATGATLTDVAIGASLPRSPSVAPLAISPATGNCQRRRRSGRQRLRTRSRPPAGRLPPPNAKYPDQRIGKPAWSRLHIKEKCFALIPERLRRLFPGAISGCIAHFESVQRPPRIGRQWGHLYGKRDLSRPRQCWALRRGRFMCTPGTLGTAVRSPAGEGPSVCIPLIVNGESHRHAVHPGQPSLMHPGPDPEFDSTP